MRLKLSLNERNEKYADRKMVSIKEICAYLGISRDTVKKWIEKGMPAHRVGRLWKFNVEEIDQWMKANGSGQES